MEKDQTSIHLLATLLLMSTCLFETSIRRTPKLERNKILKRAAYICATPPQLNTKKQQITPKHLSQ